MSIFNDNKTGGKYYEISDKRNCVRDALLAVLFEI